MVVCTEMYLGIFLYRGPKHAIHFSKVVKTTAIWGGIYPQDV